MAHDGVVRTASMSLGVTESAMSSSEVQINRVVSGPVLHSLLGYLMLVGLRFRPYDVHRSLKWSLICFQYRYHLLATMISTEPTFDN